MARNKIIKVEHLEVVLLAAWHEALDLQVRQRDISPSTATTYRRGMGAFMAWLRSQPVVQVNPEVLEAYKADLAGQYKPASVNALLAGVKRFFEWSRKAGLLASNPAADLKGARRKNANRAHSRDALTDREVLRVLAQPDTSTDQGKRDLAVLCLMAFCALRTIEINRVDLADLSTVDGLPVLRIQGKGSREKDDLAVLANARVQTAVYDWLGVRGNKPGPLFTSLSHRSEGGRLTTSGLRHLVKAYYLQAGIVDPRKTSHSLRHSAISKAARQDVLAARQLARHSSLDTTGIYVHEVNRLEHPPERLVDYTENGNGG